MTHDIDIAPHCDATDAAAVVAQLLSDRSKHIEFGGFLTNHVKHAVVALHGLGAPAGKIQHYWDEFTALTPYGLPLEPAHARSSERVTRGTWRALLGKKERFPDLHDFFGAEVDRLGTKAFVREYAPQLVPGAAGALVHGVIHFGWGVDAGSPVMIAEGAAYMAYTFVDVQPERFVERAHSDVSAVASLQRVLAAYQEGSARAEIDAIRADSKYSLEAGFHPELVQAGLQWDAAKVIHAGHPLLLELPTWLSSGGVDDALQQMHCAFAALHIAAAAGKAGAPSAHDGDSRDADFFVLHLITSLWGVDRLLPHLADDGARRSALQCFWAGAVAIMLNIDALPSAGVLERVWAELGGATPGKRADLLGAAWEHNVQRAWGEMEEHNIKLVYVERALRERYGEWPGWLQAARTFTETPGLGPGRAPFSA